MMNFKLSYSTLYSRSIIPNSSFTAVVTHLEVIINFKNATVPAWVEASHIATMAVIAASLSDQIFAAEGVVIALIQPK